LPDLSFLFGSVAKTPEQSDRGPGMEGKQWRKRKRRRLVNNWVSSAAPLWIAPRIQQAHMGGCLRRQITHVTQTLPRHTNKAENDVGAHEAERPRHTNTMNKAGARQRGGNPASLLPPILRWRTPHLGILIRSLQKHSNSGAFPICARRPATFKEAAK